MTGTEEFAARYLDTLKAWTGARRGPGPQTCPDCDNTGWVRVVGDGVDSVRRCALCQSRLRGQAPGVPVEEHGSRLANFTVNTANEDAVKHAKLWLDGVHPDLYLHGDVGTGKTRLAISLLNDRWAAGDRVEFVRTAHVLLRLQPGGDDDTDTQMRRLADVAVLCLDDVGASQATDFARRMLLVIYEARLDRGHRTIWTGNLGLDELSEFFQGDERLASRIAARAKVCAMNGPDWRLKQAKQRARERR